MNREPDNREATERVDAAKAILDEHATMSIAACDGGEPWVARAFFIEDEPETGSLDMCCGLLLSAVRHDMLAKHGRVAFMVGGDLPDHWLSGVGRAELIEDEAESSAVLKRLEEKSPAAGPFLGGGNATVVRIHVERIKVTDLDADPPITEFTFA